MKNESVLLDLIVTEVNHRNSVFVDRFWAIMCAPMETTS